MKVAIFNGSPRKKGNSAWLSNLLANKIKNADTEIYNLADRRIKPCLDCRACKTGDLLCPVKDDMQILYDIIEKSDLLVFATPIYWFAPTGIMKNFIDRFRPFFANNKLENRQAAAILTAGSGKGDCDLTAEMFTRLFHALHIQCPGIVMAEAYDAEAVKDNKIAIAELSQLARRISLI